MTLESLRWRYAVKTFDVDARLGAEDIAYLEEAIRLAPSSFGLQPYRVLFLDDAAVRAELRGAPHGQAQITEASHLVVFAVENVIDDAYVRTLFAGQPAGRIDAALTAVFRIREGDRRGWAARQAYIALGFLLFAAAERRIDASPMEGFVPHRYDEILGFRARGLSTVVIAALGRRSPADRFQHVPKLRRDDLFLEGAPR